jgi:DegV family protein with EDD domain
MKILTDTGSLLSKEKADILDVALIALQVEIKGKNYRDYFDITTTDFIKAIADGTPISSQPAIGEVMEVFEKAKDGIYIAMTSGLSSTYSSAAALVHEFPNMTIFNSMTLAGTQGYMVEKAAELAKSLNTEEIIIKLNHLISESKSYLIPVDFNYLKRNGRLSAMAALMSGFLKIKPIVYHSPGMEKLEKFGVGRTWTQAIDSIIADMHKNNVSSRHKVFVSHSDNEEIADKFIERLKSNFENLDVTKLLLSPAMTTQGGPGCIAIQYILKD